jgi:MFS family permease
MGDRSGQRRVLTRIVVWWSSFTALTGAASGFWPLLIVRFLFGAGEAGAYPNSAGVVARWFPLREHARTQGFLWAASRLGGAISPLLIVPLQRTFGWRIAFLILAAAGAAWAVVWVLWFRDDPRDQPGISAAELAEMPPSPAPRSHALRWRTLFQNRQIRLIALMYFCQAWGSWFFFAWFPTYLVKAASFTEKEMGIVAALPFLMGMIGNLIGGALSDRLVVRFGKRRGRVYPAALSLAASAALLLAMTAVHAKTSIVVLSSLGFGVADLMLPMAWAVCLDIGRANAGLVTGAMNTAGQLGGFVCSVAFGYVVTATGSYHVPVWGIAGLLLIAAYLFAHINPEETLRS